MKPSGKRSNRKALFAASWVVLSGLVIVQTAATADDGGQADAGSDASPDANGNYTPNKSSICGVAPHGLYGTAFGAGGC
jgi:hypothetical protein